MSGEPPEALAKFQHNYSSYLRAPHKQSLPTGVPERRSRVYESLLFNNICGFIDKCFPVARGLAGTDKWLQLSQLFYECWHCQTPVFSQIPKEFARFVAAGTFDIDMHQWLPELLHYEWLELEVDLDQNEVNRVHLLSGTDDAVMINPTLRVHQYQWPVHKISPSFLPTEPEPVILCVYRTSELDVRFMEINAVTAALLELVQQQTQSPTTALTSLAARLPHLPPQQIHRFGSELIEQLIQADVLIIAASPNHDCPSG